MKRYGVGGGDGYESVPLCEILHLFRFHFYLYIKKRIPAPLRARVSAFLLFGDQPGIFILMLSKEASQPSANTPMWAPSVEWKMREDRAFTLSM